MIITWSNEIQSSKKNKDSCWEMYEKSEKFSKIHDKAYEYVLQNIYARNIRII